MNIEEIIRSDEDEEIKKYRILSFLKIHISLFRKNKIYPSLTELVNTAVKLENMISVPMEIDGQSLSSFEEDIIFSEFNIDEDDEFTALVKWTIIQVNEAINEGIPLYQFVEDNLEIIRISGSIINKDEGYLIIPDKTKGAINIYLFDSIYFNETKSQIRSIKVKFLQTMNEEDLIYKTSEPSIKTIMDFIGDKHATVFLGHSDLDLPYQETILPMAKKNLLKQISL